MSGKGATVVKSDIVPEKLWKVTIKPSGQKDPDVTPADSLAFCRDRDPQVLGVGWMIGDIDRGMGGAEALRIVDDKYDGVPTGVRVFVDRMSEGDHAWVYDKSVKAYYVCRIGSDWQYGSGGRWDRYDIHHYRLAEWRSVPKPLVAGAITRRITRRRAAQQMHVSRAVREYSAFLWERKPSISDLRKELNLGTLRRQLYDSDARSLFAALDEDETEDLVGLYLQHHGWCMLKSSTGRSHPAVECQFQKIEDGISNTGYMQVKSGEHVRLDAQEYREFAGDGADVFLFSTADRPYRGDTVEGVHTLTHDQIRSFTIDNLELLPYPMTLKLALVHGVLNLPS